MQYMIVFNLPNPFPEAFIEGIPEQRFVIEELLEAGDISSYTLSMDRSTLWCLVNAESELDAIMIIDKFPLIGFMDYEIQEIMFHNQRGIEVPAFSLN